MFKKAPLFVIRKKLSMSTNREIVNKLLFIHTVEYHAAVKKKKMNEFNLYHEKVPYMEKKKQGAEPYMQNDSIFAKK